MQFEIIQMKKKFLQSDTEVEFNPNNPSEI